MKILQAFDLLSPEYGGGVVTLVTQLSKALAAAGHEVTVYTSDYGWKDKYAGEFPGVSVRPFRCISKMAGFYFTPGISREARKNIGGFDVIHLNTYRSFQNIFIRRYAKRYGVPYVIEAHGAMPRFDGGTGLKRTLKRMYDIFFGARILRDAAAVIAETELEAAECREYGVPEEKIVRISPPFDTSLFAELPPFGTFRQASLVKDRRMILFVGRINWIKGLDHLVEAFSRLTRVRDDVVLVIVGPDDGYKSALVNVIDGLNLSDRVILTGFLSGEEKLAAFRDADVMVQTSMYERGARSAFEVILCGTPVIVSRRTGAGEEVAALDAGYLADPENTDELVETIRYVLDNPEKAAVKTVKAREYITANLSLAKGVTNYEDLYRSVTGQKKKSRRRKTKKKNA